MQVTITLTNIEQTIRIDNTQQTNIDNGPTRLNLWRINHFSTRICHNKKKISTAEKTIKCLEHMVDTIKGESSST